MIRLEKYDGSVGAAVQWGNLDAQSQVDGANVEDLTGKVQFDRNNVSRVVRDDGSGAKSEGSDSQQVEKVKT